MNNVKKISGKELVELLEVHHRNFSEEINALTSDVFEFSWKEKWTPGQQLIHIQKSIAPVVLAFRIPRFLLKFQFGVTNRPSRSYDELVARYLKALEGRTATAPKAFQPTRISFSNRSRMVKRYQKTVQKLIKLTQSCSEKDLDYYVLPHPLIGKLTLREMIYFSIYHVQHHHKLTKEIIDNHPSD